MTLEELAGTAEVHAREEHGLVIGAEDVEKADQALRAEARGIDPARRESVAACYGAWLGRLALRRWQARWIGLSEPVPPRLMIGGIVVSPIDAVRRRMLDPSAPSLPEIVRQFEQWSLEQESATARALANQAAWDGLAGDARFTADALPADPETALDEWVRAEGVRDKDLLCLGAGGGRHGPLHALAGARVTVVDLSERQLDHDRKAAAARGLALRTVCASIDRLEALAAGSFDVVVQPVSACYVPDVGRVYAEVARVTRPGGLYVVQHKQPASLQGEAGGGGYVVAVPGAEGRLLPADDSPHREAGTSEYLHTLDALLGGLCRAGFVLEEVAEPPRADALAPAGSPGHRAWFLPPYLKIKARRTT